MKIEVKRFEFGDSYTVGKLFIDDKYECFTLEDKVRVGIKVPSETAIPVGEYKVIVDVSSRFKKLMPHVLNVKNFTGIRIHSGNTSEDTEGCILLGTTWSGKDFIGESRVAYNKFFTKLTEGLKQGTVTLIIS